MKNAGDIIGFSIEIVVGLIVLVGVIGVLIDIIERFTRKKKIETDFEALIRIMGLEHDSRQILRFESTPGSVNRGGVVSLHCYRAVRNPDSKIKYPKITYAQLQTPMGQFWFYSDGRFEAVNPTPGYIHMMTSSEFNALMDLENDVRDVPSVAALLKQHLDGLDRIRRQDIQNEIKVDIKKVIK